MKEFFKKIMVWKLDILAKMYLRRFKPDIIAVTGNVGKTSTKEAIVTVLGTVKKVRFGKGNLNNEFGVPLTIIGNWSDDYYEGGNSFLFWAKVLFVSFFGWFFTINYPEVLVLEYGADKPGDIKKLTHKYRPKIGVITAVGEVPVHVEYFSGPESLAREKARLIDTLTIKEYAILNHDDSAVYDMKSKTGAKIMSYGFSEGSTVRISDFDIKFGDKNEPLGVTFKLNHGANSFVPVIMYGNLGKSQAYSGAAATCVGIIYGMNLVAISEALSRHIGPNGRLKMLKGIKNSLIIDDTYNASPSSTNLAIETLLAIPSRRRIAILGDMLELGKYSIDAHQAIGNLAGGKVDVLICIGARAKFIADSAFNQMPKENIHTFATSDDARLKVKEMIKEGDTVLIKGSQGIRMEKIVEEIMAEPQRKRELLVRQGKKWLKK